MPEPNIILMNGASSSGKSTFGRRLQSELELPYFYLSSDQFVESGVLPRVNREVANQVDSWNLIRPKFFRAFHKSIRAFSESGNLLIVEHVIEQLSWFYELIDLLKNDSVLYIGIKCPLEEMDIREKKRGDRHPGEGRSHIQDGIHTWSRYDVEIDTFNQSLDQNLDKVKMAIGKYKKAESIFSEVRARI